MVDKNRKEVAMSYENDLHYAEYAKPIAVKGKNRLARVGLILAYIAFAVFYCLVFTVGILLPQLIAVLPVFLWMAVFFTWRHVSYECAVRVCEGKLIFFKLNGKKERVLYTCPAKDLTAVLPYAPAHIDTIKAEGGSVFYDHRADKSDTHAYCAIWEAKGKKVTVLFDSADCVIRSLKYYNKNTVWDANYIK